MTTLDTDALSIRTRRLLLRPIVAADARAFFEIHADPEAMRYWSTKPWTDPEEATRVIDADRAELEAGRSFRFAVIDETTTTLIGCCSLFRIDRTHRRAEVGYILRRSHWGRGFMSEAMRAVVDFAFVTMDLRRLEADVDPRNAASARLVARLGFRQEALMRQRWLVGGEVSDSAIYGLLQGDGHHQPAGSAGQMEAKRSATLPSAL